MPLKNLVMCVLLCLLYKNASAGISAKKIAIVYFEDHVILNEDFALSEKFNSLDGRPIPFLKVFKRLKANNRQLTAAILAFPFPFGIVGLHRIYLGCAPYVPVVYIASLGGAFGILPLVDFFVIVFAKDIEKYSNNPKVFMWVE